jgi:TPR repeat protein
MDSDPEAPRFNWSYSPAESLSLGGSRIGPYTVVGSLGQGGMGTVHHVRDELGRDLALKLLTSTTSPERLARFRREGEVTARLRHPGIVSVHAAGAIGDRPYLVYELVGGKDLKARLPDLTQAQRMDAILQTARALGYAHEQGVIHRDVKAANVLVDDQLQIRVADFGLAQVASVECLTLTGAVLGTPSCMAPEQMSGKTKKGFTPATDVWALGVLLYESLTDRRPFEAKSFLELLAQIAGVNPTPPRDHDRSVSLSVQEVCLKALEKRPADRYRNGHAFAQALEEALSAPAQRKPRLLVVAALISLPTLLLAIGWLLVSRPLDDDATPPNTARVVPSQPSLPTSDSKPDGVSEGEDEVDEEAVARMVVLADQLFRGAGVEKDPPGAAKLYRKAALRGNLSALCSLAAMHLQGVGVEQSDGEAATLFTRAAAAGHSKSMNALGVLHSEGRGVPKDSTAAVSWFQRAFDAGDLSAAVNMGRCYEVGFGVTQNRDMAISWFRKAAEAEDVSAMLKLGEQLQSSETRPDGDDDQAARWYRRAADLGDAKAMVRLALLHIKGRGVARDDTAAATLFQSAAEAGDVNGLWNLGRFTMDGRGVNQDPEAANALFRKAAGGGDSRGMHSLAYSYSLGRGLPQDFGLAAEWWRKAIKAGSRQSLSDLGVLYQKGRGVPQDDQRALALFRKAAEAGIASGVSNLAFMYEEGLGVEKNLPEAVRLYRAAVAGGHPGAHEALEGILKTHPELR